MIPIPDETSKPWTDEEPLECVMVIPEAPDVNTFVFRAPSGRWFRYRPGQFLTLEIPTPGETIWRTFTISTSPSQSLSVAVTIKQNPDSVGVKWMFENVRPGTRMKASGPAGHFCLPQQPDGKYLFISGGSGITPMMSMTAFLFDRGEQPDITFVAAARSPADLIFRHRLEHIASRLPDLKLHFVVEQANPYEVWSGYRGRLTQIMLGLMCPDYLEREVYCCGPEPFMAAVRESLIDLGFNMDHYHQESFAAPAESAEDVPPLDDLRLEESAEAEVVFAKSGKTATCRETDTILAAARASGLNIPSGCTFGLCGTCKTKKISGDVHMVHNGGITEEEEAEGYILACCSHPIGRVEVEV
ncbi:2Fe-2S iron-sulfur cluster-binding protein [Paracoccaceae bacterium GXU_MW_L88]